MNYLSILGQGEVIRPLIIAVHCLDDLHEHVVDERARVNKSAVNPSVDVDLVRAMWDRAIASVCI